MNTDSFNEIAEQMQKALDEGDAIQFSSLVRKRSKMMHNLFESETSSATSEKLLKKLTEENKKWIDGAQNFLKHTQVEIDKLKPLKTATRRLSSAYSHHTNGAGALLSQKG